jgi:membrane protein required for colicin V production
MTWVDWAIVIILVLAVLGGLSQGFFRSFFSLAGLVAGLALAIWNYARVAAWLIRVVRFESVADTIAFLLIALLVMGVAGIVGSLLAKAFHKLGLGCLDRLAGGIFGLFQGALFVTLCVLVTVAFYPQARWLSEGRLPKQFFGVCHLSTHISPAELAKRVRLGLRTLEEESPRWLRPDHGGL